MPPSTGIFELIIKKIQRQHPGDWHQKLHKQTLEIYKKNLNVYLEKQEEKIQALEHKQTQGEAIDVTAMNTEKQRREAYREALASGNLNSIINAHTNPDPGPTEAPDAKEVNVIQLDQLLIDAIAGASDKAIQAVFYDPTIDSPLSNLIKAFRKDVDTICRLEIFVNPGLYAVT